ncbi:MAG TPA: sulfite oxidase [Longimicrobiaceae bacterium]|nr:sulfite oxidase [Longimicrobiaceae bacterium]
MTPAGTPDPLNREAPLDALAAPLTPTAHFYRRSHFPVPRVDPAAWRLRVGGEVRRPLALTLADLRAMPGRTLAVTLECAGNGRNLMEPTPHGTPWGLGAVSTADFTGVPLRHVLELAGPGSSAVEVLFEGADRGPVGAGREEPFARSLPLAAAAGGDALLAWAMNGEPLPAAHGFPLRLVVPGWYGMASVKWLADVRVLAEPFRGHFQAEHYVYVGEAGTPEGTPVARARVRSLIASPADGAAVPLGPVELRGIAWSGHAPVARVEVSVDDGATWAAAELGEPPSPHAAAPWSLAWLPPRRGEYRVLLRAADLAGNVQPEVPVVNALGYGNNCIQRVRLSVV